MVQSRWHGKRIDLIKEACRHGEAKLAAQVQIATSADQRASVLAGIYSAIATGIFGALVTQGNFSNHPVLTAGCIVTSIMYFVGAALCISATFPVSFWAPGNDPSAWYDDIENDRPIEEAIGDQAAHFDDQIKTNDKTQRRNNNLFFCGAVIGIVAPLAGIIAAFVVALVTCCCDHPVLTHTAASYVTIIYPSAEA